MFKFIVILIRFPFWLFARVLLLPKFRFPLVPRKWRTAKQNRAFDSKMRKKQRAADKSWNDGIDVNVRQIRDNNRALRKDSYYKETVAKNNKRISELLSMKK